MTSYNYIYTAKNHYHRIFDKGLLVGLNSNSRIDGIWFKEKRDARWQVLFTVQDERNLKQYNPVLFLNYVQISNGAKSQQYLFPLPSARVQMHKRGDKYFSMGEITPTPI